MIEEAGKPEPEPEDKPTANPEDTLITPARRLAMAVEAAWLESYRQGWTAGYKQRQEELLAAIKAKEEESRLREAQPEEE